MTPKEKAKELYQKHFDAMVNMELNMTKNQALRCALICVDEIIKTHIHKNIIGLGDYHSGRVIEYWQEVKNEIENL